MLALLLFVWTAPTQAAYHMVKRIAVGGEGGWDHLEADSVGRISCLPVVLPGTIQIPAERW